MEIVLELRKVTRAKCFTTPILLFYYTHLYLPFETPDKCAIIGMREIGVCRWKMYKNCVPRRGKTKGESTIMKIIDNPVLGIGLLLCVGLAVLGLTFLTTAEGQNPNTSSAFTTDDAVLQSPAQRQVSPMHTEDDDSPFIDAVVTDIPSAGQAVRAQTATQTQETQQGAARVTARATFDMDMPRVSVTAQRDDDPFAPAQTRQRTMVQQSDTQPTSPRVQAQIQAQQSSVSQQPVNRGNAVGFNVSVPSRAEKRDELLFRIVQLRLLRGEYEKITSAVEQMQNPEKAIEAMLDHAEETDDENIEQLLDVATALTLQIGQPRPAVPPGMGMPGGMVGPTGIVPGGGMVGPETRMVAPGTPSTNPLVPSTQTAPRDQRQAAAPETTPRDQRQPAAPETAPRDQRQPGPSEFVPSETRQPA